MKDLQIRENGMNILHAKYEEMYMFNLIIYNLKHKKHK